MKNTVRKILSLALALTLLSAGMLLFAPTAVQAEPADTSWKNQSNLIYYYTDFYPSLTNKRLSDAYGTTHAIRYEYGMGYRPGHPFGSDLEAMVDSGYFNGFRDDAIVIIDIKTVTPSAAMLTELFNQLKPERDEGCTTVLITACGQDDISSDNSFLEKVDIYLKNADTELLRLFFEKALDHLNPSTAPLENTNFLLEGRWVGDVSANAIDFDALCASSLFLRLFVQELKLEAGDDLNQAGIRLLAHTCESGSFRDLLNQEDGSNKRISYSTIEDLTEGTSRGATNQLCAFGCLALEQNYYNDLYRIKKTDLYDIPIYVFQITPVVYGPDGLSVIESSALDIDYQDQTGTDLLGELHRKLS